MKKYAFLAILVLFVTAWLAPTAAYAKKADDPINLTIMNKKAGTLIVILRGEHQYYFSVEEGKQKFEIEPGKYTLIAYSTACSGVVNQTKNLSSKSNLNFSCQDSQLIFGNISNRQGNSSTDGNTEVEIYNNTGSPVTIWLVGTQSYFFYVEPGRSPIRLLPGRYTYTIIASCGRATGKVKFHGGGSGGWKIWCK